MALASEKWETFLDDGSYWVNALAREGDYLWIGTEGKGVIKWDLTTKAYQEYTTDTGDLPNDTVHSIAIDSAGNKWFGTNAGVTKFDGSDWTTYDTDNTSGGLADNSVYAIAIDSAANKWFGTNAGVSVWKTDGTWNTYDTLHGLAHPYVRAIAFDSEGNKWFGTLWGGVSKFDGIDNWTTYNTSNSDLAHDWVYSIAIDSQGNKWFGTYNGVNMFDGLYDVWFCKEPIAQIDMRKTE